MNNQINDPQFQSRENLDYQSLKNNLYFIYKTCFQNILQQQNIIDINQIKLDEIILHIKSLMNNIIEYQTQIQNYIIKLEADVRHLLKREFQFNILKNSLESKIRAYMNMEEDYQELKEKVHFSEGKFLENDRKDNEISILKKENSSVKKEIIKLEKKYNDLEERLSKDQDIIDELKLKNDKLNNLVSELKKEHFQNMRSNSSINLNIINNNNINPNKNKKNGLFLKQKNTFFNTPKSNYNLESLQSNINQSYMKKKEFTIDNTSSSKSNYNKIFNLYTKNSNRAKKK
jgi:predicted nuclease with TOPRIM domain